MGWEGETNVHEMIRCACMAKENNAKTSQEKRKKETVKGKKGNSLFRVVESFKKVLAFRWTGMARTMADEGYCCIDE